ncbi:MAG TPA: polyprenyl synthetase family protein [Methanothrix sp.]|nr:polyprenyl synthetase family protein [Methanothrix sp.]
MFTGWDEYNLINRQLAELVRSLPNSPLGEIISYVLSSPGKRVRPLILIFSAQAMGESAASALNAAMAIELVHAASLVHDDILDQGLERRGAQSALQRFGPDAALLAGDWLISRSIELISHYSQPVISTFASACMDMSEGELMDLSYASSENDYYNCISKKTASLFSASAKMGGLIAGAGEEDAARLESYGTHLGLSYQVLDDLEEFLGLDQGKTSQKTSVTLPIIYSKQHEDETARQMCIKVIENHSSLAKKELSLLNGSEEMLSRLESIVDEMTRRGLNKCRLQKSLC